MITDTYPTVDELLEAHTNHSAEVLGAAHRMFSIARLFRIRGELDEASVLRLMRDAYGHHVTALDVHRDLFALAQIGVLKLNPDDGSFSAVPESDVWPFGGDV